MQDLPHRGQNEMSGFCFQEQQNFELEARTCKLFGLWVAAELGLKGQDCQTYARVIVEVNLEEPGFEDVLRYVSRDFAEKDIAFSPQDLYTRLDMCLTEARRGEA